MNPSVQVPRRGSKLASSLGISERIFSSSEDRAMARAIDAGLEQVEAGLEREARFADPIADVSGRYLLEAGGKRVRPLLTLLIARLGNGTTDEVLLASQAIELTHLASLYHDDVMDEADKRRGVPTAQNVWGNSVAILTGDLLFARASQLMAELGDRALKLQAATFERLVLGQLHETVGPAEGEDEIDHYIQVLADKTGALIAAAARAGIAFSGADPALEQPVVDFGERIGVAFQLVDDVIDLAPTGDDTGKIPGTDLRAGVVTLPLLKLRRLAATDADAASLLDRIERDVVGAPASADALEADASVIARAELTIAELGDHPVTRETIDEAQRWARWAVEAIAPLPEGSVKKALTKFADTIVERTS
ncbi:polyprenyl synthetase family protein [Agromyces sp. SYSU T00194]|uniref:polyprenyl synthetase family protein n=1 Tax=Agromyces chitinivorans TaxID=3158560 RepID=UPI003391C0E6